MSDRVSGILRVLSHYLSLLFSERTLLYNSSPCRGTGNGIYPVETVFNDAILRSLLVFGSVHGWSKCLGPCNPYGSSACKHQDLYDMSAYILYQNQTIPEKWGGGKVYY